MRPHKSRFFPPSWANYATAVSGSLRLVPPAGRVEALRTDYEAMQQMFLGERMPFETVLAILQEAEATLKRRWNFFGHEGDARCPCVCPPPPSPRRSCRRRTKIPETMRGGWDRGWDGGEQKCFFEVPGDSGGDFQDGAVEGVGVGLEIMALI